MEETLSTKLSRLLAYRLPKKVVYWCLIRAGVRATTQEYSSEVVPEVAFVDVLKRW